MLMVDGRLRGAPPHTPHATTVLTATVLKGAARRAPHTPRATTVLTAPVLKGAARRAPPSPPRYDRSHGPPPGAAAHFPMPRSLAAGFSFCRPSAGAGPGGAFP